jgi:hypothetical protein
MTRETQWSTFLLCVGVAALAFLINVSSAAAQGDDNTNGQSNNARGDDDRNVFAVRQGPGTNIGNCPAPPPPTERVVFPKVYCPYPPGIIPRDLTTELARVQREIRGIEQQAMADAAALGPLMPTSPIRCSRATAFKQCRFSESSRTMMRIPRCSRM